MSHLFKRLQSPYWQLRLQSKGRNVIKSSRTTDKLEAQVWAADEIKRHKQNLLDSRANILADEVSGVESGIRSLLDGRKAFVDPDWINILDDTGKVVSRYPNRQRKLLNPKFPIVETDGSPLTGKALENVKAGDNVVDLRAAAVANSADDAIIEFYISHNIFAGTYNERETRAIWQMFRTVSKNKPLAKCDRNDGRALVAALREQGAKWASVKKRVGRLTAACNLAVMEGTLKFNPFSGVAAKPKGEVNDATKRLPYSDEDAERIFTAMETPDKHGRYPLSPEDTLLLRVLASTGMRRGEAFQIDCEFTSKGVRHCKVGSKNEQSRRRVPFPASLLSHLPAKITGPLFTGDAGGAGKRLAKFIRGLGITDTGKVPAHSWRHRAKDRLRDEADVSEKLAEELFGRDEITEGDKYGVGSSIERLKFAVDKIMPLTAPKLRVVS